MLGRYVPGGDGVHMTTAGKAGLALPHHMATGGPNELTHTKHEEDQVPGLW